MGALDLMKRPQSAATDLAIISENAAFMQMIERATRDPDINIDKLKNLMELYERRDAALARKSFDAAVADAKALIPPIVRNATGHNNKKYADLSAIAKVIDPILGQLGLSYRFRTQQADKISVTCILSHKDGHAEETTLCGPSDTTGNKNAIQAIGSTLTYLQRYSLVQMLGLAAAEDDDGAKGGTKSEPDLDPSVQFYIDSSIEKMDLIDNAAELKAWWEGERQMRVDLSLGMGKPGYKELFQAFSTRGKELVKIEEHA